MVSGASVNFVSPIETFPGGGSLDQDENQGKFARETFRKQFCTTYRGQR